MLFAQSSKPTVRIGIITDFTTEAASYSFVDQLKTEIQQTVGNTASVVFSDQNMIASNYDADKAFAQYQSLSKRTDIILVIGGASFKGVIKSTSFPVPTLGIGVFDPKLQNIPYLENGTSGVENLSYILTSNSLEKELKAFHDLVQFKQIAIFMDERTADIYAQNDYLKELTNDLNATFQVVPVGKSTDKAISSLDPKTDAVFTAITYEKSPAEVKSLADAFIKAKLPSFSILREHVDLGILSSLSDDNGIEQLRRKVALTVEDAIAGKKYSELPVALNFKEKLFFNIATAQKIDFSPTFETLFTAEVVGQEAVNRGTVYSLNQIVSLSLKNNLDIKLSEEDVNLSSNDISFAKSQFLPQVEASASALQIDEDRATASFGAQAEQSLTGSGSLTQLIYSEQAIANIQIQKYLAMAQKASLDQQALSVILDTFEAYFNVLKAKTGLQIQQENFESSKTNLEFAKVRVSIGASNRSDLYRWESEVANATQAVIEAQSAFLQSKLQLGRILNMELNEEFDLAEVSLDDKTFENYTENSLGRFIQTPAQLETFTSFLVKEAQILNPAIQQIDANVLVLDRQLQLNKRSFFTPTLALQAGVDNKLWTGGAGSDVAPTPGVPKQNDITWNVGLNLSLPIFAGGQRKLDLERTTIQQKQIDYQRRDIDQQLELGIRAQLIGLVSASTNVNYSQISAENAQKNFVIVQDSYKRGLVPINQLIDAQNAAFSANLNYSNSVYNYLLSFIRLENIIGRYTLLSTDEENQAFITRYFNFIQQ
tara:strand:+ start:3008 stop:5317 length:2310 start_codon:yes stop_codon:yes gene_type:complete